MNAFPTYMRLREAVYDRVNQTGAAPKSVACGTATKLALNRELLELMDVPNPKGITVVQQLDCGFGPIDLYADTRLADDAMELRNEPSTATCHE